MVILRYGHKILWIESWRAGLAYGFESQRWTIGVASLIPVRMSTADQTPAAKGPAVKAPSLGLKWLIRNPGLYFLTIFRGRFKGRDDVGNQYYERPGKPYAHRWVVYGNANDPTSVPPEWHAWLHHITDAPLAGPSRPWQRPHRSNQTGTPDSYRPSGHDYMGGRRAAASADYEIWTPDQL